MSAGFLAGVGSVGWFLGGRQVLRSLSKVLLMSSCNVVVISNFYMEDSHKKAFFILPNES